MPSTRHISDELEVPLSDFGTEIRASLANAQRRLATAREDGDDYLVDVLQGQVESLTRIALEHHVVLDAGEPAA